MTGLEKALGVQEGQGFTFRSFPGVFKIEGGRRWIQRCPDGNWNRCESEVDLSTMIANHKEIKIIQPKPELSESTKAKLRALRVVWPEFPWIAADANNAVYIYKMKPFLRVDKYQLDAAGMKSVDPFDSEITHDMGPVYYGDL